MGPWKFEHCFIIINVVGMTQEATYPYLFYYLTLGVFAGLIMPTKKRHCNHPYWQCLLLSSCAWGNWEFHPQRAQQKITLGSFRHKDPNGECSERRGQGGRVKFLARPSLALPCTLALPSSFSLRGLTVSCPRVL